MQAEGLGIQLDHQGYVSKRGYFIVKTKNLKFYKKKKIY